eukprot:CAMPEP_0203694846 /NCGR_PEP_ID=MMETSP0091-20130426/6470_1 /ASSEMBLY_ACC=CAM_ASM_001089 /TAXON_ID=426623 /ORGANISM="Chaetoceros affinis, Strain CCMP159" /LENGTH=279 /DNA_ID=CAMNT_0050566283 /DNA_START=38 /DNA_END=880 /DNA_ORIENTATION=+
MTSHNNLRNTTLKRAASESVDEIDDAADIDVLFVQNENDTLTNGNDSASRNNKTKRRKTEFKEQQLMSLLLVLNSSWPSSWPDQYQRPQNGAAHAARLQTILETFACLLMCGTTMCYIQDNDCNPHSGHATRSAIASTLSALTSTLTSTLTSPSSNSYRSRNNNVSAPTSVSSSSSSSVLSAPPVDEDIGNDYYNYSVVKDETNNKWYDEYSTSATSQIIPTTINSTSSNSYKKGTITIPINSTFGRNGDVSEIHPQEGALKGPFAYNTGCASCLREEV